MNLFPPTDTPTPLRTIPLLKPPERPSTLTTPLSTLDHPSSPPNRRPVVPARSNSYTRFTLKQPLLKSPFVYIVRTCRALPSRGKHLILVLQMRKLELRVLAHVSEHGSFLEIPL